MLAAIDELNKNKKTPDIDTIELYEWAVRDFLGYEAEYADTLGPLRARWAKANPGSPRAVHCLQACVDRWDLVSAQQVRQVCSRTSSLSRPIFCDRAQLTLPLSLVQIATTLDKAHANSADRRYMFWNITLTFLLSVCNLFFFSFFFSAFAAQA